MYAYRSRFHVFILWLGFFFFLLLLALLGNKQTNRKKDRKRIRRLRLWVTKLTVECCLVWYCKHIHFNNFYERLHDDLNAPDFVLHISYIIKIVTKKGKFMDAALREAQMKWHYAIGCVASKEHKHTNLAIYSITQTHVSRFVWADVLRMNSRSYYFHDRASRADSNIKPTNLSYLMR